MKKVFLASVLALAVMSCSKKEETGTITTQETTTATPETTTETTVTPVDSATATAETTATTTVDKTTTEKKTTGEVFHYTSEDGKTKFSVIYDNDKNTAAVKNESTGKTYDMKSVSAASGAKYQDADGNYFWSHQGEFSFGKGETDLVKGKESK